MLDNQDKDFFYDILFHQSRTKKSRNQRETMGKKEIDKFKNQSEENDHYKYCEDNFDDIFKMIFD